MLINWSDEEKTMSLDLRTHGIESFQMVDFWTEETMDTSNGRLVKEIKPHASYLGMTGFGRS